MVQQLAISIGYTLYICTILYYIRRIRRLLENSFTEHPYGGHMLNPEELIWTIPAALLVIAVFQLLYLMILSSGRRRRPSQPTSPVMPRIEPGSAPPPNASNQPTTLSDAPFAPDMGTDTQAGTTASAPRRTNNMMSAGSIGKFIILNGLDGGMREMDFPSNEFGIGRFHNLDANILVALDEKSISRKHAIFICDEQIREYYLVDTNSSYGTHVMVNGEFRTLNPGKNERVYNEDVVQFGNNVTVRLVLPCETREDVNNF